MKKKMMCENPPNLVKDNSTSEEVDIAQTGKKKKKGGTKYVFHTFSIKSQFPSYKSHY